jgi:hypothetical protein
MKLSEYIDIFFGMILLLAILNLVKNRPLSRLLSLVFLMHAGLNIYRFNLIGLYSDEKYYYKLAILIYENFNNPQYLLSTVQWSKSSISLVSSLVFYFLGPNPIYPLVINSFVTSLLLLILVVIRQKYYKDYTLYLSDLVILLLPQLLFFTFGIFREPFSYLGIALSLLCLQYLRSQDYLKGFIFLIASTLLLLTTRIELISVNLMILIFFIVLFQKSHFKRRRKLLLSFLSLSTFAFLIFPFARDRYLNEISFVSLIEGNMSINNELGVLGNNWRFNSSFVGLMINTFRSIFGPPYSEWGDQTLKWAIVSFEGFFLFLVLSLLIAKSLANKFFAKTFLLNLLPFFPFILLISLILSNYGLNLRLKSHLLIPVSVLCSIALYDFRSHFTKLVKKLKG